jgi:hypothetical protein
VYEVIRNDIKTGMTVGEVIKILREYYMSTDLWKIEGWALGYELGLSLPPDWVGDFYFSLYDENYLDRIFEDGMVTNFESFFNAALIDTIVYKEEGVRTLSKMPAELVVIE